MNKIDYKSAYESVLIANGMLRQENAHLKEQKQELRSWLEKEVLNKLNELENKNA